MALALLRTDKASMPEKSEIQELTGVQIQKRLKEKQAERDALVAERHRIRILNDGKAGAQVDDFERDVRAQVAKDLGQTALEPEGARRERELSVKIVSCERIIAILQRQGLDAEIATGLEWRKKEIRPWTANLASRAVALILELDELPAKARAMIKGAGSEPPLMPLDRFLLDDFDIFWGRADLREFVAAAAAAGLMSASDVAAVRKRHDAEI